MSSSLSTYLKSPLLLPIYLALVAVALIQAVLIISVSTQRIDVLQEEVNATLAASQSKIGTSLDRANERVLESIGEMTQEAGASLHQKLSTQLHEQELQIEESMRSYLLKSATATADILAELAPPFYWDNDIPELTRMVEMAHRTDDVVFAIYLDKDEKALTRFLNRRNPKVKELLKQSKVRGSVNKVLDAAPKDDALIMVSKPVASNDVVIGRFIIGVSKESLKAETARLRTSFEELANQAQAQVSQTLSKESTVVTETLNKANAEIGQDSQDSLAAANATIEASSGELSGALLVLVVITSIILFVVMVWVFSIKVLKKVNVLRAAIWDIAEGEGDLTQRASVPGRDEIANMAKGLNRFIENTGEVVRDVNHSADVAGGMTVRLRQVSNDANQSVDAQRLELDQVSSAISQMASTVQHVADSIRMATEQVEQIRDDTGKTASISAELKARLNQMMETINNAALVVDNLATHSNEIGSVVDVIKGIAEQTNLLALNAAIEAARAGESGRGFAVVADEVRALASKTQQSTEEIVRSIDRLQQGSGDAVKAIEDANRIASESLSSFAESDEHLASVNQSVNRLFDMTSEIASMSSEQTQVAGEIEKNIVNIHGSAEDTSSKMREAAEASSEIDGTVSELQSRVSRFKV